MFKEKLDEICNLRENCESLAQQVGKELILENKLEIQNKIIYELITLAANLNQILNVYFVKKRLCNQGSPKINLINWKNKLIYKSCI